MNQDNQNLTTNEEQELANVLDNINQQVDNQAANFEAEQNQLNQPAEVETNQFVAQNDFNNINQELEQHSDDFEQNNDLNSVVKSNNEISNNNQSFIAQQNSVESNPFQSPSEQETEEKPEFNQFNKTIEEPEVKNDKDFSKLDEIKNSAVQDLKPIVDKLNLSNEERFDIELLLIRSTDDESLIEPAYELAKKIEDEAKRAQALLDIIKEAEYFSSKDK